MKQRITIHGPIKGKKSRRTGVGEYTWTFEGDYDVEVENLEHFVQVEFLNSSGYREYTYIDPSGVVKVGDLVEVDTVYGTSIAKVVALGKGSYNGPFKSITARLSREVL